MSIANPADAALADHIAAPPTLATVLDAASALIRTATEATGTRAETAAMRQFADVVTDAADLLMDVQRKTYRAPGIWSVEI